MLAETSALKQALAPLLALEEAVTLDVGGIERIDTAGMQLLAAFVRERRAAARAVCLAGRSGALAEAASLLGLSALIETGPASRA